MNNLQRNEYLTAMQIDTWLPRVDLPYAAPSSSLIDSLAETETEAVAYPPVSTTNTIELVKEIIIDHAIIEGTDLPPVAEPPHIASSNEINSEADSTASFSLQLMQAGGCLLLVELPTGEAFQIRDPAYQLLRNILRAVQLPDSPLWLGDIIHWPLFKQASIPQGAKEAQEFLHSFINTYQEQETDNCCLWLIGLSAIRYTTGLTEQAYFQTPSIDKLGQTILSPSLELLIDNPSYKAQLWQSIRKLIPLWQA